MKRLVVFLGALALLAGCSSPYNSVMSRKSALEGLYEYEGNTVRYTVRDVVIEATSLPREKLDLYFSIFQGGKYQNPFPGDAFAVYSVSVENRGGKPLIINTGRCFLFSEKGNPKTPEEYTSFYADLSLVDADRMEERMEAYKATIFRGSLSLGPGETVQRLMAFRRDKGMGENATLILSLYYGYDEVTVPFPFVVAE